MNLPEEYLCNMRALLGEEYGAFLACMEREPWRALRENPARPAGAAYAAERVPWCPQGYYVKPGMKPGASLEHFAGGFYLQEPSAMAPAMALGAQAHERALDLCAAPGGKATQIAATAGALLANEIEPRRARVLLSNLERMGAWNAAVTCETPARLAAALPEAFDAVLVDAPCSGEGMFRRDASAIAEWSPGANEGCRKRQREILACAARLVRPGGRMVYSTCTFSARENEENVEWFLREFPDFAPDPFELPGLGAAENGCMRVYPHRARGEGHFVARLRRGGGCAALEPAASRGVPLPQEIRAFFARLPEGEICRQGDLFLLRAPLLPPLDGLRALRGGLPLATERKGVFRPEHAAAMALKSQRSLALDFREALEYASGAPVAAPHASPGWARAEYNGLPLGWGKITGGVFKNHLPKGLRLTGGVEAPSAPAQNPG